RRHTRLVSDWSSDVYSSDLCCCQSAAGTNVKTELVAGPVAGQNAGARADSWMGYWEAVRSRLGILRGCLAGLSAVALVTFFALRLNLNLSASGSLYFLIVVMVSVIWGFWEGREVQVQPQRKERH